jgi:hypothetical protein
MEEHPVDKTSLPSSPPSGDIVLLILFVVVAVIMFAVYLVQLPRDMKNESPTVLPTEAQSALDIGSLEIYTSLLSRSNGIVLTWI